MFATTAALTTGAAGRVLAAEEARPSSPNEKYSVAIIGTNGRGRSHIGSVLGKSNCEITYLCDPDSNIGQRRTDDVAEKQGTAPKFVQDMRRVFDDDSVDIVTIATQNHWHALAAIWAMQAGKDVYVEKPVSHNVSEGRRIVQVARKEGRVCQTGTQIRSMRGTQEAIEFVHSGGIGEVKVARGTCYKRRNSIGHASQRDVPKGVDYNLWLGPAPERAFTKNRFHYNWHWHGITATAILATKAFIRWTSLVGAWVSITWGRASPLTVVDSATKTMARPPIRWSACTTMAIRC